jgi:deazaflavin-dependent oxidoreductase (nitroreductase family)
MQVKLTTTGRRSGEPREVTLYAWPDGEADLVLVASQGGKPDDPAWASNLRAEPVCTIKHGKTTKSYRAREVKATGAARDRLWELVTVAFPMYRSYQKKTDRLIPLFVLTPVDQPD